MKICIIGTGGTIEKTYDETDGSLRNVHSVLDSILLRLRLHDLDIRHVELMNKDSLDLTNADRETIVKAVQRELAEADAIIVVHGTDTLSVTGELLCDRLQGLRIPVVLTGAMRPYEFRDTDAIQNVTESLLACRLLTPGVYAVIHNKALQFPGVVKDRERMTFVRKD
ncbi:MAG TPA: asparaginase domain-containing protein [Phycisphaerae bacterium]|nr:asparaginase domain-containing protein [Phycisphaerae bacterium]HRW54905.1 asparaginase domain-containing protein [Phycisphaerae bacterium]